MAKGSVAEAFYAILKDDSKDGRIKTETKFVELHLVQQQRIDFETLPALCG